jgi:uncharacterized membrane protein
MGKGRLEAFSDGVFAVLITILVLELHVPHGADVAALRGIMPNLAIYLLSFVFIGLYWNNHHHMFQAISRVDGRALWANHHLLFWLSLVPFGTAWLGAEAFAALPTAFYGFVLLCAGIAYRILQYTVLQTNEDTAPLRQAVGRDNKGMVSIVLYLVALACAFTAPIYAYVCYILVALMWIVPDRRIERVMKKPPEATS